MSKGRFLVVGLGVLGNSVATALADDGAEVIAVDNDPQHVEQVKDRLAVAAIGDATDRKTLEQLGSAAVDAAIVCVGENFQSAVLATAHLLDLDVKRVVARANSDTEASIMRRLGAHEVFFVERAMGKALAHRLLNHAVMHEMDLGGGYQVVQILAPEVIWRKALQELELPKRFGVQVVAVRAAKDQGAMKPAGAATSIDPGDTLLLSGLQKDLSRLLTSWKM